MDQQTQLSNVLGEARALRREGDYFAARDACGEALRTFDEPGGGPLRAQVLIERGRLSEALCDFVEAEADYVCAAQGAEAEPEAQDLLACALARQAGLRRFDGRLKEARSLTTRALALLERGPGPDTAAAVDVLVETAHLDQEAGDSSEAERLFLRAVALAEGLPLGPEKDEAVTRSVWALGNQYRMQGRYDDAEGCLRTAMTLAEEAFGPQSIEVAGVRNDLGVTFKFSGRFAEAEALYRSALPLLERAQHGETSDMAALYHNLGGLEHARGNYEKGEPHARRSVEINVRTLGADHLATALDRAALAAILTRTDQAEEAEQLLRDALTKLRASLGNDHHEVAVCLNNLAAIAQRRGNLTQAESLYRDALAIKESIAGPNAPELATTLNNLAMVYKAEHRYAEAEPLSSRAVRILEASVEADHPNLAVARANHAKLLFLLDDARRRSPKD